jgi:hypothetical protein
MARSGHGLPKVCYAMPNPSITCGWPPLTAIQPFLGWDGGHPQGRLTLAVHLVTPRHTPLIPLQWSPRMETVVFQRILANITSIRIRASFTPDGAGFLDNVVLQSARRSRWMPRLGRR